MGLVITGLDHKRTWRHIAIVLNDSMTYPKKCDIVETLLKLKKNIVMNASELRDWLFYPPSLPF